MEGGDGREALQLLFLVLPPSFKKEHLIVTWGLVGEKIHERRHEKSRMIFFVQRRGKHFVQRGDVLAYA